MNKLLSLAAALLLATAPAYAATTKPTHKTHHAAKPATKAVKHAPKSAGGATKALNALQSAGYTSLTNFGPRGKVYGATVTKDGKTFNVTVDAAGKVVQG